MRMGYRDLHERISTVPCSLALLLDVVTHDIELLHFFLSRLLTSDCSRSPERFSRWFVDLVARTLRQIAYSRGTTKFQPYGTRERYRDGFFRVFNDYKLNIFIVHDARLAYPKLSSYPAE